MKKMLIALVVLLVLSAGSLTAFFIAKNKHDEETALEAEQAADYVLFNIDSDSVSSITIDCPDGYYVAELDDEDEWELTNTDEFVISQTYPTSICTYMSELTASKDYGEIDDEKKQLYGLDDPTVITVSDGENDYTVYVGDPDPTGSYYYVMVSGKDKIYAVETLTGSVLKTSRTMMMYKLLLPYTDRQVEKIQLFKDGETVYDLTHDDDTDIWSLTDEYSLLDIDKTSVTAMINVMTRIEVQQFFDSNLDDYSKYGFDNPVAELAVTGEDGKEHRFLFSYYGADTSTYTYVLFEDTGQVATFYTGDVDFIERDAQSFLYEKVCEVYSYDLSGIDFSLNGSDDVFEMNLSDDELTLNGKDIDSDAFSTFFTALVGIEIENVDLSISPVLDDVILSADYHYQDGTDKSIAFCKADDDSCYVFINGEFSGATVDIYDITGTNSVSTFYDELTD